MTQKQNQTLTEETKQEQLQAATSPEEIREALKNWTPQELAEAGIV